MTHVQLQPQETNWLDRLSPELLDELERRLFAYNDATAKLGRFFHATGAVGVVIAPETLAQMTMDPVSSQIALYRAQRKDRVVQ